MTMQENGGAFHTMAFPTILDLSQHTPDVLSLTINHGASILCCPVTKNDVLHVLRYESFITHYLLKPHVLKQQAF